MVPPQPNVSSSAWGAMTRIFAFSNSASASLLMHTGFPILEEPGAGAAGCPYGAMQNWRRRWGLPEITSGEYEPVHLRHAGVNLLPGRLPAGTLRASPPPRPTLPKCGSPIELPQQPALIS